MIVVNLGNDLLKCAEDKVLSLRRIAAQPECYAIQPVFIFDDKPFRTNLAVFAYCLDDVI